MFYIESINSGGDDAQVSGGEFSSVMREVNISDSAILDVGSSNIERVLARAQTMKGVLDDFDYFMIPVVPKSKQEIDTVKLIEDLEDLGIAPAKIKVVCNQLEPDARPDRLFPVLFPLLEGEKITWAAVHESETYGLLGSSSMSDALALGFDFKAHIRATTDVAAKRDFASRQIIAMLARSTSSELDGVFKTLFGARK